MKEWKAGDTATLDGLEVMVVMGIDEERVRVQYMEYSDIAKEGERVTTSRKNLITRNPVPMPVHDQIEADNNSENISLLVQGYDHLLDTGFMFAKYREGSEDVLWLRMDPRKLALDFFEYDYEAWLQEKEDLNKYLNDQWRIQNDKTSE